MDNTFHTFTRDIHTISTNSGWRSTPRSYEHYALLVISEMCEAVNADRKDKHANLKQFEDSNMYNLIDRHLGGDAYIEEYKKLFETYMKDTYEDEFADICIRLLDMSDIFSMNLSFKENVELTGETLTEKMFHIVKDFASEKSEESLVRCFNQVIALFGDIHTLITHIKYKIEYNRYNEATHHKKY